MTVKELSQLYWLKREVAMDEKRLLELEELALSPKTPNYDGMPHAPSLDHDAVMVNTVEEILDLKAAILAKKLRCFKEQLRLEEYIASVPDSLTRQIFTLRFIECLSWAKVAARIGGGNTDTAVRLRVYRYLKLEKSEID